MSARVEFYETKQPIGLGLPDAVQHRWRLRAGNGEIVATGEAHTRREDAERAFLTAASIIYTVADQLKRQPMRKEPGEDVPGGPRQQEDPSET